MSEPMPDELERWEVSVRPDTPGVKIEITLSHRAFMRLGEVAKPGTPSVWLSRVIRKALEDG